MFVFKDLSYNFSEISRNIVNVAERMTNTFAAKIILFSRINSFSTKCYLVKRYVFACLLHIRPFLNAGIVLIMHSAFRFEACFFEGFRERAFSSVLRFN